MIVKILLYIALFLNGYLIGRIVTTDCSNDDLVKCCRLALFVQFIDIVIFACFAFVTTD